MLLPSLTALKIKDKALYCCYTLDSFWNTVCSLHLRMDKVELKKEQKAWEILRISTTKSAL